MSVEAIGLGKSYGNTRAVDQLSFALQPGVVTGFLGPNGEVIRYGAGPALVLSFVLLGKRSMASGSLWGDGNCSGFMLVG